MKLVLQVMILMIASLLAASAVADGIVTENFSFNSCFDGTGPLQATAVYAENAQQHPLMVVQHGYNGTRQQVMYSAQRMAKRGYFVICISTRGWDESAGRNDDGGIEIMDIYDGIKAAAKRYEGKVDATRVSIVGYSNGGANVFFATVRFPYLFRASLSFFGIPDYAHWIKNHPDLREQMVKAIGAAPEDAADKYIVRNAALAAENLSGTRFHIAYDEEEKVMVPMNSAFAEAAGKAGYQDIFVHASKPGDEHRWLQSYNNGHLSPLEDRFMDDIEKSNQPRPVMPATGKLNVLGFVVTPLFRCVLGNGDDAAATLTYDLRNGSAHFKFTPLTSNHKAKARVTLFQDGAPCAIEIIVNGKAGKIIGKGNKLEAEVTIESTLEFREKK